MKKVAKSLREIKPYLQSVFFFLRAKYDRLLHYYFIIQKTFPTSVTIAICASIFCLIYTQISAKRILYKRYQMPLFKYINERINKT